MNPMESAPMTRSNALRREVPRGTFVKQSSIGNAVSACMSADDAASKVLALAEEATFLMQKCVSARLTLEAIARTRRAAEVLNLLLKDAETAVQEAGKELAESNDVNAAAAPAELISSQLSLDSVTAVENGDNNPLETQRADAQPGQGEKRCRLGAPVDVLWPVRVHAAGHGQWAFVAGPRSGAGYASKKAAQEAGRLARSKALAKAKGGAA